jgi:hypothetical protein
MRSVRACLKKDRRVDDDVILSYLVVFTNVVLDSNATTVCLQLQNGSIRYLRSAARVRDCLSIASVRKHIPYAYIYRRACTMMCLRIDLLGGWMTT